MSEELDKILEYLQEMKEDSTIPKNVKLKIDDVTNSLKTKEELSIRVNRALNYLDEIADDSNLQPYARTQIWNIVSLLEKLC